MPENEEEMLAEYVLDDTKSRPNRFAEIYQGGEYSLTSSKDGVVRVDTDPKQVVDRPEVPENPVS